MYEWKFLLIEYAEIQAPMVIELFMLKILGCFGRVSIEAILQ